MHTNDNSENENKLGKIVRNISEEIMGSDINCDEVKVWEYIENNDVGLNVYNSGMDNGANIRDVIGNDGVDAVQT